MYKVNLIFRKYLKSADFFNKNEIIFIFDNIYPDGCWNLMKKRWRKKMRCCFVVNKVLINFY